MRAPRPCRRLVLGRIANRQQLDVVVLEECDGIMGTLAGVHTPRMDIEAHLAVLGYALLEIWHADPHVVDTGKHG